MTGYHRFDNRNSRMGHLTDLSGINIRYFAWVKVLKNSYAEQSTFSFLVLVDCDAYELNLVSLTNPVAAGASRWRHQSA